MTFFTARSPLLYAGGSLTSMALSSLLSLTAFTLQAQTNPPSKIPVLVTNWTMPWPQFRWFNGKVCDTSKGGNWESFNGEIKIKRAGVVALRTFVTRSRTYHNPALGNSDVLPGGFGTSGGGGPSILSTEKSREYGKTIVLTNAPNYPTLTTGADATFTAIKIGTRKLDDDVWELWDCGRPYLVPTVRTNWIIAGKKG